MKSCSEFLLSLLLTPKYENKEKELSLSHTHAGEREKNKGKFGLATEGEMLQFSHVVTTFPKEKQRVKVRFIFFFSLQN